MRAPEPSYPLPTGASEAGPWQNAKWRLPVSANLPVQVIEGGYANVRSTVTGSWRQVTHWRSITMSKSALKSIGK